MIGRIMLWLSIISLVWLAGCANRESYNVSDAEMEQYVQKHNAKVKHGDDKIICKKVKPTGTMFTRLVCKKKRDWDLLKQGAQELMQKPKAGPPTT